ncbi:hypothetical protein ILYODFUR_033696 [Ilyodon furcidens]|uniref:Uncharacterized protein n=1 Tax=Ilyodon furcidens TaxID=33524 RepID=A0ABV0VB69_9TELE
MPRFIISISKKPLFGRALTVHKTNGSVCLLVFTVLLNYRPSLPPGRRGNRTGMDGCRANSFRRDRHSFSSDTLQLILGDNLGLPIEKKMTDTQILRQTQSNFTCKESNTIQPAQC